MLARWQRPEYGLVMPGVFLPVAEEADLMPGYLLGRPSLADAAGPPTPFWPKRDRA